MRELFVYYRIKPGMSREAGDAVVAFQRDLSGAHANLVTRLLKRIDDATAADTWMEIYAARDRAARDGSGHVVDDALESEIAARALVLAPFIDGSRHVERFEAADPP